MHVTCSKRKYACNLLLISCYSHGKWNIRSHIIKKRIKYYEGENSKLRN
jgi:hypothetical protein